MLDREDLVSRFDFHRKTCLIKDSTYSMGMNNISFQLAHCCHVLMPNLHFLQELAELNQVHLQTFELPAALFLLWHLFL